MPRMEFDWKPLATVLAFLLTLVATPASALGTYRVGIDLDPQVAGGCDFDLMGAAPNATNVDLLLELTVTSGTPPMITGSDLYSCNPGLNIFESPVTVGPVPWPMGLGVGVASPNGAGNVVEAVVPASMLPNASLVELVLLATSTGGSVDALSTTDGTPGGPPISFSFPPAVPGLSPIALLILSISLLGMGWLLSKRWTRHASLVLLLAVAAAAPGVAWALVITLDGAVSDWALAPPVATDSVSDSSPTDANAEVLALFATSENGTLSLRFDLAQQPNLPPTVDSISLTPLSATESDTLVCTVSGSDGNGDPVTFAYAWEIGGGQIPSTGTSLNGAHFNKADTVVCVATPNDGIENGLPVGSNSVVIQNTPPFISSVAISPASPTDSDTLVCQISGVFDLDGDSVASAFEWEVNGVVIGQTTSTLSAAFSVQGDSIRCTATPNDGTEFGASVSSAPVVIQ